MLQPNETPCRFDRAVRDATGAPLTTADRLAVLQVNIGLRCNLECAHCHVVSSPRRTEAMDRETMVHVLRVADQVHPDMVDITGGAPEMHPEFRWFVTELTDRGHTVQVRTNLTIFFVNGYADLPEFFASQGVHLVASLPCYLQENVDRQRGDGVFHQSIEALRRLNDLGYGREERLPLHLVYNPTGPHLPPAQQALEQDYRERLGEQFGIAFTGLYTITNMPIGRWRADLQREGALDDYFDVLEQAFNPATIDGLMCRHQIEVAWDGTLYDCDFHLAHRLPVEHDVRNIRDFDPERDFQRRIATRDYCFGCTAGAGSSCGGALA
ncbi:MAG: radical SAM/Cys-rich domain protein [Candidatus Dadabacteria bacterium]|nr:MAG: radical SAM/Cys-rich domain protein [Candidatus Dadabacteria bacterium]